MTSYFDERATRARQLRDLAPIAQMETAQELEEELVRDVSICAEFPGLPENLRDAIHKAVWRNSYFTRPHEHRNEAIQDDPDVFEALSNLVSDLHSVFHAIGTWARDTDAPEADRFSDSPRSPLVWLCGNADERRETLCVPKAP